MSFKENLRSFVDAVAYDIKLIWSAINSKPDLGDDSSSAFRGDLGAMAYDHSQQEHSPASAQKNSDITKEEIETKLVGEIVSHSHPQQELDDFIGIKRKVKFLWANDFLKLNI